MPHHVSAASAAPDTQQNVSLVESLQPATMMRRKTMKDPWALKVLVGGLGDRKRSRVICLLLVCSENL